MYFNEKEDTNIDKEFNNNSFDFNKYKKPIIIGGIVLISIILIIVIVAIINNRSVYYLTLNGDKEINYYQGVDYIDPGYIAKDNHGRDLTSSVEITGNVNKDVIGTYNIKYKIGNKTVVRTVNIVEKPINAAYIHLIDGDISITEGKTYQDPGYQVFSYNPNDDLQSKVVVTGTVDTSKKGIYIVSYSVVTQDGVTITAKRTITVN